MGLFSNRVSQKDLAILSRSLGTSLHSGIDVVRAFELSAAKTSGRLHQALGDVLGDLQSGSDVSTSIETHGSFFPALFTDMVNIGEQTGALPEVFRALATHYENNLRLRKEFLSQIMTPVIQLTASVFIIAGLIYLLGWIGTMQGTTIDVLGWGLVGGPGALKWLGGWAIGIVSLFIGYRLLATSLEGKKLVHRLLMSVPVVGGCMQSFAIARFSWAFHLTQQAGMPIDDSLDASLRATSNGAFIGATPRVVGDIMQGSSLTEALEATRLFPIEFNQIVLVAETSGTVPEALDRLSPQFEDDARRSLQALAAMFGWLVWALVASFIIFVIFSIAFWYIGMINDVMRSM